MKKLSLIALVAVLLVGLNSCQYKNPALEDSQNPMVKEFEVANLLLGKTHANAEKTLKDLGYTQIWAEANMYEYERKVDDVEIVMVMQLGSKNKVFMAGVIFEPMAADTYLKDFSKFKEVVTTFGSNVKISTKENCEFQLFANSAGNVDKIDYNTMLSRIDSSTNGFECLWAADDVTADSDMMGDAVSANISTLVDFSCSSTDYMSYDATLVVASKKYK